MSIHSEKGLIAGALTVGLLLMMYAFGEPKPNPSLLDYIGFVFIVFIMPILITSVSFRSPGGTQTCSEKETK